MTVLVDTIRQELDARRALREHLDQEITTLDRMLQESAGLAQLPAVVPPPVEEPAQVAEVAQLPPAKPKAKPTKAKTPAKPKAAKRPSGYQARNRSGRDGLGPKCQEVLEAVRELGDCTIPDLATKLDQTSASVGSHLKTLRDRGLVEGFGPGRTGRRYRPVGTGSPRGDLGRGKPRPAPGAVPDVDEAHRVEDRRAHGQAMGSLRTRVLDLITKDPDALTEDRLALALGESRDDIADACGALLLDDQVVLNPDHTYRTAGSTTTRQGGGTTPMNQKTDIVEQVIARLVRASKDEIIYQAQRKGLGAAAAEVAILDLVAAGKLVDTAGVLHRPVAAAA